jgi:hypothetical protein
MRPSLAPLHWLADSECQPCSSIKALTLRWLCRSLVCLAALLLCLALQPPLEAPTGPYCATAAVCHQLFYGLDASVVRAHVTLLPTFDAAQRPSRMGAGDRRHSLPFLSGDGFRQLADVVVDEAADIPFALHALGTAGQKGSRATVVFCAQHHRDALLRAGLLSAGRVVLVLGNSDSDGPPMDLPALEHAHLAAIFSQNCLGETPRVRCLPIGLANRHYRHGAALADLAAAMLANAEASLAAASALQPVHLQATSALASACFAPETYPLERAPLQQLVARQRRWVSTACSREPAAFYRSIAAADASLSPRGNGLDTHRTWEVLMLGRLVVTRGSSLDALWRDAAHEPPAWELPVLALGEWQQLEATRVEAAVRAARSQPLEALRRATERLFLPFWACEIGTAAGRGEEFCSTEALLRVLAAP